MARQTGNALKSLGLGLLAGAAVSVIGSKVMNHSGSPARQMKKTAGRALHTMSDVLTELEKMVR